MKRKKSSERPSRFTTEQRLNHTTNRGINAQRWLAGFSLVLGIVAGFRMEEASRTETELEFLASLSAAGIAGYGVRKYSAGSCQASISEYARMNNVQLSKPAKETKEQRLQNFKGDLSSLLAKPVTAFGGINIGHNFDNFPPGVEYISLSGLFVGLGAVMTLYGETVYRKDLASYLNRLDAIDDARPGDNLHA